MDFFLEQPGSTRIGPRNGRLLMLDLVVNLLPARLLAFIVGPLPAGDLLLFVQTGRTGLYIRCLLYTSFQRAGDSYLWQTEDGAANINVVVNRNEQHLNVWDVDKAYLSDLESQFVDEIDRQMASMYADSYATVNAIRTSRTTVGDYPAIAVDVEIQYVIQGNMADTRQYSYTLTSKKYVYTITFTMQNGVTDDSLFQGGMDMIESFVIRDEVYTQASPSLDLSSVLLAGVVGACISGGIVLLIVLLNRRHRPVPPSSPPPYPPYPPSTP